MDKYLNLKRIVLTMLGMLTLNIVNAQITSFKVKGDADKFYVVTFNDGGWFSNFATELELGRSSVNLDTSWRGSMIAKFRFHVTNWGHESEFIDVDLKEDNNHFPSNAYFIAGWRDVSFDNASNNIVVWLRGSTTYYYKSNYPVNPVVYDGVAPNSLTYTPGGTPYSLKTAIDSYVNTYGMTYSNTAYFNGSGTNYYAGNVGIGTAKPGTYKLAVEGTIGARKIKVTQGAWADFVFEQDYKLPSLMEIENYVKQHKHLPDVPSEKEVLKEGVDLGEMNKILLQKIEELTLHMIEQEKRLLSQQEQINRLTQSIKEK